MKILESHVFVGPSLFSEKPVMTFLLDMGGHAGWTVSRLDAGRYAELSRLLPELQPRVLRDETRLPELFAQIVAALQIRVGCTDVATRVQALGRPGQHLFICEYETALVTRQIAQFGVSLLLWLAPKASSTPTMDAETFDPAASIRQLVASAPAYLLDQTTTALKREAERRGIPCYRLNDNDRVIQLGQGARQIRTRETLTGHSSTLASSIAQSKARTQRMLLDIGLPVPRQIWARSEGEAIRAADQLGYPVVVKPDDRGKGLAVSVGLKDRQAVIAAFRKASGVSASVLVERNIPGDDHRLLVVDGRLVAGAKRIPGQVMGDGRSTVEELVAILNRDPRRGVGFEKVLTRIELDDEADRKLSEAGLTRTSIPELGQQVILRGTANLSTGGTSFDVTGVVHPDNRRAAERAARVVGLDIAGVDFITTDISRSWREVGGAIIEINQSPGPRPHWAADGSPAITPIIMDSIVPPGSPTRVPIAAIAGSYGKTSTARLVAHVLGLDGRKVGSATSRDARIGQDVIAVGDFAGANGAKMLTLDPAVEAMVLEFGRMSLIAGGLFIDRCDVGAVLNLSTDHVGVGGIGSIEGLAATNRLVVAHATKMAVLNADDPHCAGLAGTLKAKRVCLVTMSPSHALVQHHVAGGQPAVWLDDSGTPEIVLQDGEAPRRLVALAELPFTGSRRTPHDIESSMFAAAIAYGLGEPLESIATGLRSFLPAKT